MGGELKIQANLDGPPGSGSRLADRLGDVGEGAAPGPLAEEHHRRYLEQVLKRSGGDMKEAARVAGVNPSTLYRIGNRAPPKR